MAAKARPKTTAALPARTACSERKETSRFALASAPVFRALERRAQREEFPLDVCHHLAVPGAHRGLVRLEMIEVAGDDGAPGAIPIARLRLGAGAGEIAPHLGEPCSLGIFL